MAKVESPQIQVLVDSVRDRGECHPCNVQQATEQTPLLRTSHRRNAFGSSKSKLRSACCVRSRAALAIICWNGLVSLYIGYMFEFAAILATDISHMIWIYLPNTKELQTYAPAFFGFLAILYLFYPLAGCLADIKCGRYKTVLYSLWFITWGGVFMYRFHCCTLYSDDFRELNCCTCCGFWTFYIDWDNNVTRQLYCF